MHFRDFTEGQIKSAFINYSLKQDSDMRLWHIVGIVFKYFEDKSTIQLTDKEERIKNFIFSEKIFVTFKNPVDCAFIKKSFNLKTSCPSTKRPESGSLYDL